MSAQRESMPRPSVSVLMPVYNGEALLRGAIDSVLGQTLTDFELIVVDDGSTDRTPAILSKYDDPRVVRITHERNRGLIAALNTGLAAARGDLIARQDADDASFPERFEIQVEFFRANAEVTVLGSDSVFESADGKPRVVRPVDTDPLHIAWILLFYCPLAHSSIMFRRDPIVKLGSYHAEDVFAEDFALWARAARSGKVASVGRPLVVRRRPKGSITESHGAEMAKAARRVSLENLVWLSGKSVSIARLDAFQALCGNRPMSLGDALGHGFEKLELPHLANQVLQDFWTAFGTGSAGMSGFRRWALRWMATALLRRSHQCLANDESRPYTSKREGLRLARFLALTAARMSPGVVTSRRGAGVALRSVLGWA